MHESACLAHNFEEPLPILLNGGNKTNAAPRGQGLRKFFLGLLSSASFGRLAYLIHFCPVAVKPESYTVGFTFFYQICCINNKTFSDKY